MMKNQQSELIWYAVTHAHKEQVPPVPVSSGVRYDGGIFRQCGNSMNITRVLL